MSRPKQLEGAADEVQKHLTKAALCAMRAVALGIGDRTEEEIKAAFSETSQSAPLWAHAATRIATSALKAEGNVGTVNNTLNLIIAGREKSNEAWLERADEFKAVAAERRKALAIEAKAKP